MAWSFSCSTSSPMNANHHHIFIRHKPPLGCHFTLSGPPRLLAPPSLVLVSDSIRVQTLTHQSYFTVPKPVYSCIAFAALTVVLDPGEVFGLGGDAILGDALWTARKKGLEQASGWRAAALEVPRVEQPGARSTARASYCRADRADDQASRSPDGASQSTYSHAHSTEHTPRRL